MNAVITGAASTKKKSIIGAGESDPSCSKNSAMETAWAYVALSTAKQAETREDQERIVDAIAARNGWNITRRFGYGDEAIGSGKNGVRPLLQRLIAELEATPKRQRPRRILMSRLDRVGRVAIDSLGAMAEIWRLGVVLHDSMHGDLTFENAFDVFRPVIAFAQGQEENAVRSQKWKDVHARRRAAGLHVGKVPFGVILVDGRATPYEPESRVVREIFEKAALGWGYTRLATFARERAPKKRQPDGSERAYRWAPATIKTLMESKTLRGLVIDDELWQRARSARSLDFRTRAPKRYEWPLVGAVQCTCGRMLRGHASGAEPFRVRYLICFDESHGRPHPSHRADALEAQFAELLGLLTVDDRNFPMRDTSSEALAEAERLERDAMKAIDAADRRRRKAWALADADALTAEQLREQLDEVDADRARASADLDAARAAIESAKGATATMARASEVLARAPGLWGAATPEQRREIARLVAALPEIGGLFCDPARRNQLLRRSDKNSCAPKEGKADDSITKKFIQSITE